MDWSLISHIWHTALLYYSVLDHFIWAFVFWLTYKVCKLKKKDLTFEQKLQKVFLELKRLEAQYQYPHKHYPDDYSEDDGWDDQLADHKTGS